MKKSLLIIFSIFICLHNVNAATFEVNGIVYEIRTSTAPLEVAVTSNSSYGKYKGNIVIPETVSNGTETYQVTTIGNSAFYGCGELLSVQMPKTITSIAESAFYLCVSLSNVTFPETLKTIGNYAFYSCNAFTTVNLPNSVTQVDYAAFSYCRGLKTLNLSTALTDLSFNVFKGCSALTSLTIPSLVTTIANSAFGGCTGIKFIRSLAVTPPTVAVPFSADDDAFSGINKIIPLEVPETAIPNYKAARSWKDYMNIYALDKVFSEDGKRYAITSANSPLTAEIICGETNYSGDFVLSSAVTFTDKTYNITRIGIGAFSDCTGLISVTLPNSVTEIGYNAFKNCTGLKSANIGNNITKIGGSSFYYCTSLKDILLPVTLKTIDASAFTYCASFTSIVLPDSVKEISSSVFSNCNKMSSIKLGNQIHDIGESAFSYCQALKTLQLPDLLRTIGKNAFCDCSGLTLLKLPASVTSIGEYAFSYCTNISSVFSNSITPSVLGTSVFYGVSMSIPLYVSAVAIQSYKQADQWKDFTNIIDGASIFDLDGIRYHITSANQPFEVEVMNNDIPYSGVISIPDNVVFNGNSYAVKRIFDGVFYQNKTLTSVSFGNSIKNIKTNMFSGCSILTSVTTGNAVDSIGDNAFLDCSALKTITIPATVKFIGVSSFMNCSALTAISLGNSIRKISDQAFYSSGLTSVTIPDSAEVIGKSAFAYCSKLAKINFNNELKEISSQAFYYCSSLTSVSLPKKLNKIGDNAFYYCSSLTSANIPNPVQRIELNTFRSCSKLSSVTLGNGLKYIGQSAFYECSKITSLVLPAFVDTISDWAFCSCNGVKILTCNAVKPPVLGYLALSGIALNIPVYVPVTSIDAYKADVNWNSFTNLQPATILEGINYKITSSIAPFSVEVSLYSSKNSGNIEIPSIVTFNNINYTVIGVADQAFEGYTAITSIKLPNSLKYVGTGAFRNCTSLVDITLSDSITRVGSEAFYNTAWYNAQNGTTYLGKVLIDCKLSLIGQPFTTVVKDGTEVIADYAFNWCIRMTNITLPTSLKYIGSYAFSLCGNLNAITCNAVTPPALGELVFYGVNTSIPLTVPTQSVGLYKEQLQWQNFFTTTAVETNTDVKLRIYPNPATDFVCIDGLNISDNIVIFNSLGKIVFSNKCASQIEKLDLTLLNDGIYIFSVFEDSRIKACKQIVVKK